MLEEGFEYSAKGSKTPTPNGDSNLPGDASVSPNGQPSVTRKVSSMRPDFYKFSLWLEPMCTQGHLFAQFNSHELILSNGECWLLLSVFSNILSNAFTKSLSAELVSCVNYNDLQFLGIYFLRKLQFYI